MKEAFSNLLQRKTFNSLEIVLSELFLNNTFRNVFYFTILKLGPTRVLRRIKDVFFPNRPHNVQCDKR